MLLAFQKFNRHSKDIREIWKDMVRNLCSSPPLFRERFEWMRQKWRAYVDDRQFVPGLLNYFCERFDQAKGVENGTTPTMPTQQLSGQDEWTLEYITVSTVQPIIEVFDDEAAGFVRVNQVNEFTSARPKNWR